MKLFGLVEFVDINHPFFPFLGKDERINIPQHVLYKKLSEYNSNLSIGLELTETNQKRLDFENAWFETPQVYLDLHDYFKSAGNNIYYLESVDYYRSIADIINEMISINKKSGSQNSFSFGYGTEQQVFSNQIKDLKIKLNYMTTLGKEGPMIESISKSKPDLVFVGEAHASRFFKNKDNLLKNYGIEIEEYWREKVMKSLTEQDIITAAKVSDGRISMEDCLSTHVKIELEKIEAPEQLEEDFELKQIEELYNSIKD